MYSRHPPITAIFPDRTHRVITKLNEITHYLIQPKKEQR